MFTLKTATRVAALALTFGIALTGVASAQQHKWKAQSLYGPNTVVFKDFQKFSARVKEVTKGAVDIETLPVATIVPQAEALDAVKAGLLDAASGTMAYQGGKEPAAAFWDLTAGYDNPLHLLMWYRLGGGMEIMNKIAARWGRPCSSGRSFSAWSRSRPRSRSARSPTSRA
jgi:TRAP-type transport system periplasmic protein